MPATTVKTRMTPFGYVAKGALMAYLAPRLAMDARVDLAPILSGVTAKNFADRSAGIAVKIRNATRGKLAEDADVEDLSELLDAIEETREAEGGDEDESYAGGEMGGGDDEEGGGHLKKVLLAHGIPEDMADKICAAHREGEDDAEEDAAAEPGREHDGGTRASPGGREPNEEDEDEPWRSRAADARRRLGRDESEEERERREREESAHDARERLGRDESDEERERREAEDEARFERRRTARDAMMRRGARDRRMGHDEPPPFRGRPNTGGGMDKRAMDAAINTAVSTAVSAAIKNQVAIRDAERAVRPWVGELNPPKIAFDSADAVYKAALDVRGIDTRNLHPSAYRPILESLPRAGATPAGERSRARPAMDAATTAGFHERFKNAARIGRA